MEPQPRRPYLIAILAALVLVGAGFLVNASSRDALGQASYPGGTLPSQPSQAGQSSVFLGPTTIYGQSGGVAYDVYYARANRQLIAVRQGSSGETAAIALQRNVGYRRVGAAHLVVKLFEGGKFAGFWAYYSSYPTPLNYPATNFVAGSREIKFTVGIPINGTVVPFAVRIDWRTFGITASSQQGGQSSAPKLTGLYSAADREWIIPVGLVAYSVRLNVAPGATDAAAAPSAATIEALTLPADGTVGAGTFAL